VGPLTLSSADTPPFGMAWQPRAGAQYATMNRAVQRGLLAGIQRRLDAALASMNVARCPVALLDWPLLADRMLQLTVPSFEYPRRDLPATVQFVGPVFDSAASDFEVPHWWDVVLGARTVVHVTQGTLDNIDVSQLLGPAVRGLADRDVVVIATTGRSDRRCVGVSAPNAFVTDFVPYSMLMPHVDVMITNGGYGGVQRALSTGVPVVVAGSTEDKPEVAARVAWSGAGINLKTGSPTPPMIRDAVREILGDGRHLQRAREFEVAFARRDGIAEIAALVDEIVKRRRPVVIP